MPQEHVQRLVPGMIGAVNYGTAKRAQDPLQTVAGKTGSCIEQSSQRPWVGLFTSYAPVHDPKLAVAVILRSSGARGKWASAVAGEIYRNLHHRFGIRPGSAPVLADEKLAPSRPKIDARAAALLSDEEKEDEADEATAADAYVVSESNGAQSQTTGAPSNVQKTARTIERNAPALAVPATKAPALEEKTTNGDGSPSPRDAAELARGVRSPVGTVLPVTRPGVAVEIATPGLPVWGLKFTTFFLTPPEKLVSITAR